MTFSYKILDENGNYTTDWESNSIYTGYESKVGELEMEFTSLSGTGEYYCVFVIQDIYGGVTYSKPIKYNMQ
jgi:hypothetical protein